MAILIEHPWLAGLIALVFLLLWRWRGHRLAGVTCVVWAAYLIYEYLMYARILCSGDCNIRVDLLLIYPPLVFVSLAALLQSLLIRSRQGESLQ